jgi:cysteine-rich repeat protein
MRGAGLNLRRRIVPPLVAACAAVIASCAPNEQAQTVSFVLSDKAPRVNAIEFVVSYKEGKFAATDGQCVVSSAAGPRQAANPNAQAAAKDAWFGSATSMRRHHRMVVLGGSPTTTVSSSTSTSTSTTTTTSTMPPVGTGICGDRVIDSGEQCDDGNNDPDDGCTNDCDAAFSFLAEDNDETMRLRIVITNGRGIAPGATLAFCKFQGDVGEADLTFVTSECGSANGGNCTATATVTVSTTSTTTTTTTSTTSTTIGDGDTTTTSSTITSLGDE